MGREVRRVALDFKHPIGKVWPGFICNEGGPCPADGKTCFNGLTAAGKWLESIARFLAMVGSEAAEPEELRAFAKANPQRRAYPHPYLEQFAQAPRFEGTRTTWGPLLPLDGDLVKLLQAFVGNEKPFGLFGNRELDLWDAFLRHAGLGEKWGYCPICEGHGDDPAKRAAAEAWVSTPPPAGDGWQFWETTSEGSPRSPVFKTAVQLATWLHTHEGYTMEAAQAFVERGWAMSMVSIGHADGTVEIAKDVESCHPDFGKPKKKPYEKPTVRDVVCKRCLDTHVVHNEERGESRMCTSCPTPCERCRQRTPEGGGGPYCATTPCICDCHVDRRIS